jgi:hypothetical protein
MRPSSTLKPSTAVFARLPRNYRCIELFAALDVFGSRSLYARGWTKVARGLLAEVYDHREPPSEADALRIVRAATKCLGRCQPIRHPAPGIGQTLNAAADGLTFTGVVEGDVLYHAIAASSAEPASL